MSDGSKIYLVASSTYDKNVHILSTDEWDIERNFKASISTHVEPDHYECYDTFTDGVDIKTITRVGEHLYIDTVNI